jgi:hypothetical protein
MTTFLGNVSLIWKSRAGAYRFKDDSFTCKMAPCR